MRNWIICLLLTVAISSCETEGFDAVPKEAVFETNLIVDGEEINIQAGVDGYSMETGFAENISGKFDYFSEFVSTELGTSQLNFSFDDLPALANIEDIQTAINSDLAYALNFTGTEGIMLVPNLSSLNSSHQSQWSVGDLDITNDDNTLIPLPFLRDIKNIPVQYKLEVSNGFKASLNGSFNYDLTESCSAVVQTSFDQSNIYFELTAFTQSPLQIDWSNGESTPTATYSAETEQVTVDVISQNCNFGFDLELTDPSTLPDQIGFETIFTLGPATSFEGPGLVLEYIDTDGTVYRSDYGEQNADSQFLIHSIEDYETNPAGNKTVLMAGDVSCKVFSLDTNSFKLISAEDIKIALAYQG